MRSEPAYYKHKPMPLARIVSNVNRLYRHKFPMPQAPEEVYITFKVECDNCNSVLIAQRGVMSHDPPYWVEINDIFIDDDWTCQRDQYQEVLCRKLAAFL